MKFQRIVIAAFALALAFAGLGGVRAQDEIVAQHLFITEDGTFSIRLVEGWYASGDVEGLQVANREILVTETDTPVDSIGDIAFIIQPLEKADVERILGVPTDSTLLEIATAVKPFFENPDGTTVISNPEDMGGVARMTVTDPKNDALIYVADNLAPGFYGVVVILTPKDEMTADTESAVADLLGGVQFSLPLTETFADANNNLSFSYPADWVVQDNGNGVALMANNAQTLQNANNQLDLAAGEFRFFIVGEDTPGTGVDDVTLIQTAANLAANLTATSVNNPVVAEPVILLSDQLTGTVIYVEITSDIAVGGLLMVNRDGVVHEIIFQGDVDLGDRVLLSALNISKSLTYTPVTQ